MIGKVVAHVDVLVGNEEDLEKGLGTAGTDVSSASSLDPAGFISMIERVVARYPNVKLAATTLREVVSSTRHRWSAVTWDDGERLVTPVVEPDVYDRIGGGDGFASGLFYGLMSGESPEQATGLGWTHGALLTTTPGDTTMVTLPQVRALAHGGSARVQR